MAHVHSYDCLRKIDGKVSKPWTLDCRFARGVLVNLTELERQYEAVMKKLNIDIDKLIKAEK